MWVLDKGFQRHCQPWVGCAAPLLPYPSSASSLYWDGIAEILGKAHDTSTEKSTEGQVVLRRLS